MSDRFLLVVSSANAESLGGCHALLVCDVRNQCKQSRTESGVLEGGKRLSFLG